MPATTRQMAEIAGVSEQTVRNFTRRFGELLSPQARGETGSRLFGDEDIQVFCSIAALRRENVPPDEVIARLRHGDVYIELAGHTTPHQATPSEPQATFLAPQAPSAPYSDLQRQIDVLRTHHNTMRNQQNHLLKAAVLWGALWGAVAALAFAAFVVYLLWLLM